MFNEYPYTDYSNLNLDPMLKKIGEAEKGVAENASAINREKQRIDSMTGLYNQIVQSGFVKSKVLAIGDSYAQGWTPEQTNVGWPIILAEKMGLNYGTDFQANYYGGAGFVNNPLAGGDKTFLGLLNETASYFANPEDISMVLVLGGANDGSYTVPQLENAIATFVTRAKGLYPNAAIIVGVCSVFKTSDVYMRLRVSRAYTQGALKAGGETIGNVTGLMLTDKLHYMASDERHPSQLGQEVLAGAIYDSLRLGGYHVNVDNTVLPTLGMIEYVSDNVFHMAKFNESGKAVDLQEFVCNGNNVALTLSAPENFAYFPTDGYFWTTAHGYVRDTNNKYYLTTYKVKLYQDKIYFYPQVMNLTNTNWLVANLNFVSINQWDFSCDCTLI